MAVKDKHIEKNAKVNLKCLTMLVGATATGQSDTERDEITPGFAFEIVAVEVYGTGVTAVGTIDLKIGSTSALASAVTPVAGVATAATVSTTLASRRGTATSVIKLHATTDGSGEILNGRARVWIRPTGLNGEA